jgi:hypothetical protein
MNPNIAEVGHTTRWPPGQSGNPAGKTARQSDSLSQGFIRDYALVWAERA